MAIYAPDGGPFASCRYAIEVADHVASLSPGSCFLVIPLDANPHNLATLPDERFKVVPFDDWLGLCAEARMPVRYAHIAQQ